MRYLKFNIVFVLVFLLVGCNAIQKLDKSDEYKDAPTHDKRLVLPKDMNANVIENHYLVPKANSKGSTDVSIEPPKDDMGW
ncbi:conserved hypothetical protein [Gammaproteobacteria bacterium]